MVLPQDVVTWALTQRGKPYRFGASFPLNTNDPPAHDCSSLVQWAAAKAGARPVLPRTSSQQHLVCRGLGLMIPIEQAVATRGALLIVSRDAAGNPFEPVSAAAPPPPRAHIAFSLGDGFTMEAFNPAFGTNIGRATYRTWSHAALVPGVDYRARTPATTATPRPDRPVLRAGSRGPAVADAQRLLITSGATRLARYGPTGAFLSVTDEAVRWFQSQVRATRNPGMVVDGIVGPITWGWLYAVAAGG